MPRPLWDALAPALRADIERLAGGRVVDATSCAGGFSPGFASRLALADGRRVFVKAIDAERWPHEVAAYRDEVRVNATMPESVPAPRFLGSVDDQRWVVLAFDDVDGTSPGAPWTPDTLGRVVEAAVALGRAEAPDAVTETHFPRLGGWATLTADRLDPWAAGHLPDLVALEKAGLELAHGDTLVHCDLYPHNILLTPDRVVFVDWPHARRGSNVVDLVTVLSSAVDDGLDPDAALRRHAAHVPGDEIDAVLAAHAGFLVSGGLAELPPGLERIAAAKRTLGAAATRWLRHRLRPRR